MPPPYNNHIISYRDMWEVWIVILSDPHKSQTCHVAGHMSYTCQYMCHMSKIGHTLTFELLELQTSTRCQNRGFWGCWIHLDMSSCCTCVRTLVTPKNSTVHCLFGLSYSNLKISKWPLTQIGGSQNYLGSLYWSGGNEPSIIYIDRNCNHMGGHKKS